MGVVYEAEQESLNRRVALKVLAGHGQGDANAMARFESEARAAARMHHTNIVPVFEVGRDSGHMFYAMQLIHGHGLDKVIDEVRQLRQHSSGSEESPSAKEQSRPTSDQPEDIATLLVNGSVEQDKLSGDFSDGELTGVQSVEHANRQAPVSYHSLRDTQSLEAGATVSGIMPGQSGNHSSSSGRSNYHKRIAEIGQQVARALGYAHGRGVIHRDIKPSNLMLDATGTVWVTDFGLAKTSDTAMTHTGDILGTLRYMSPERFQGECDARADIYSLGLTLYELLVLQPAFNAKDRLQLIELVTKSVPPNPRSLDSKIPRDLETIILKCIDPAPRHRYQTANDLADELGRFLAGEPILARAIGPAERAVRWCRRKPWIAALSATAVMSLVTGTIVSTVLAIEAGQNAELAEHRAEGLALKEQETQSLLKQVELEKQKAERELHQSQRLLNLNRIQSADREWKSSHAATAWRYLNAYQGGQFDWEHRYLTNLFRRNHTMLSGHQDDINAIDISADGTQFISAVGGRWNSSPVGEVRIHDRTTGATTLVLTDYLSMVTDVAFHPDGSQFVASCRDGSVRIRDAITGQVLRSLPGTKGPMNSARYNHDGSRIVGGGHDGDVLMWDTASGEVVFQLVGHQNPVSGVAFSPDSSLIVTASGDNTLKLWDAGTGDLLRTFSGHHGAVYCVAFDATGSRIVSGCWDSEVIVWEVASGKQLTSMQSRTLAVYGVAFSPDGSQVASGSYDQKVRIWDAATGKQLRSLEGHTGTVYDVAFSADGSQIFSAAGDRTIRTWDSSDQDETSTLYVDRNLTFKLAYSPDSRRLLSVSDRPRIRDPDTGEAIVTLEGDETIGTAAWSHDGRTLAGTGHDGKVVVWEAATGRKLLSVDVSAVPLLSLAISRDGQRIAVGGNDGVVHVVDAETGGKIVQFNVNGGEVKGVAFSPDGQRVYAGGSHGAVRAWDSFSGQLQITYTTLRPVYAMALSDDGTQLAAAGPTPEITIWETQSGEEIAELVGHNIQVFALAISPDGSRLFAGGSDKSIEVWDLIGKESTLTLEGHHDAVTSVAFRADGQSIVSVSRDGVTRIWDASENASRHPASSLTQSPAVGEDAVWIAAEDAPCPPSPHTTEPSLVIIENHRSAYISVFWSDGNGIRRDWGRIESGAQRRVPTYTQHCWVLTDENGKELGHLMAGNLAGKLILSPAGGAVERSTERLPPKTVNNVNVLETLNSVLQRDPSNAGMLGARASWFGAHGRWEEATTDLKKSLELNPQELSHSCYLAALLAFQGQKTAYEEHCQQMLQTWRPSDDPRNCERAAKACLLLPDVVDSAAVNQLVQKALTVGEDYGYYQYFLMLKGLNALRQKDFNVAIEACEQSRGRAPEQAFGTLICANFVIEAQAHHHLGHSEQARQSLAAAKQLFDTVLPAPGKVENPSWPDWLIARILFDQADELINAD
jgi:WD40 repeat protein/serine/threonine protein kinase/tetratricopeptide (TPR) repeat protein